MNTDLQPEVKELEVLVSRATITHAKQVLRSIMQTGINPAIMSMVMSVYRILDEEIKL